MVMFIIFTTHIPFEHVAQKVYNRKFLDLFQVEKRNSKIGYMDGDSTKLQNELCLHCMHQYVKLESDERVVTCKD